MTLKSLINQATDLPWYAVPITAEVGGDDEQAEVWFDAGLTVASMGTGYGETGERKANARLICLAVNNLPALVEALCNACNDLASKGIDYQEYQQLIDKIDKEAGE